MLSFSTGCRDEEASMGAWNEAQCDDDDYIEYDQPTDPDTGEFVPYDKYAEDPERYPLKHIRRRKPHG